MFAHLHKFSECCVVCLACSSQSSCAHGYRPANRWVMRTCIGRTLHNSSDVSCAGAHVVFLKFRIYVDLIFVPLRDCGTSILVCATCTYKEWPELKPDGKCGQMCDHVVSPIIHLPSGGCRSGGCPRSSRAAKKCPTPCVTMQPMGRALYRRLDSGWRLASVIDDVESISN